MHSNNEGRKRHEVATADKPSIGAKRARTPGSFAISEGSSPGAKECDWGPSHWNSRAMRLSSPPLRGHSGVANLDG